MQQANARSARMMVLTAHRRFIAVDGAGRVVQCHYGDAATPVTVDRASEGRLITDGPLGGFTMLRTAGGVQFKRGNYFLSADEGTANLVADRLVADAWETFTLLTQDEAKHVIPRTREGEAARFGARVAALAAAGEPVKVYCGAGNTPRPGFLNLDIKEYEPEFGRAHPDEYFIFPFADMPWSVPDNCVDYIFHEDFMEHISQLQQIQFLAETLRVLKPGAYHRVNSPNLLWTMRERSQFARGHAGVYTGELQWGHVSLLTPGALKELAELVGYRHVIFTTKDHGVSPYAEPDCRPDYDRDPIVGNVFADLQK